MYYTRGAKRVGRLEIGLEKGLYFDSAVWPSCFSSRCLNAVSCKRRATVLGSEALPSGKSVCSA